MPQKSFKKGKLKSSKKKVKLKLTILISGRHYIFSKKIKVVAKFSGDHSIKEKKGIQGTYSISFVTQ